jgi:hypothetical protein
MLPIIRLPREFRKLTGVSAMIYETMRNGALVLVVLHWNRIKGHEAI